MAQITITELTESVSVENTTQAVTVSGATDYPITIEYNATIVEGAAGPGVPTGGTAGQILTKVDSTDYNTTWATPSATGLQNIVEDTTPQLGGNLDLNGKIITNSNSIVNNGNIILSGSTNINLETGSYNFVETTRIEVDSLAYDYLQTLSPTGKVNGIRPIGGNIALTATATTINSDNIINTDQDKITVSTDGITLRAKTGNNVTVTNGTLFTAAINATGLTLNGTASVNGSMSLLLNTPLNVNNISTIGLGFPTPPALTLSNDSSTSSIVIKPAAENGDIVLTAVNGNIVLNGQSWPATASSTAGLFLSTDAAGNLSWQPVLTPPAGATSSSTGITSTLQTNLNTNGFIIYNATEDQDLQISTFGTGKILLNNLAFPNTDGTAGQVLKTDGGGDLYWADDEDTITIVSESQPQVAEIGSQWFNPTTQILKVYTAAGWVQVTADDLQF